MVTTHFICWEEEITSFSIWIPFLFLEIMIFDLTSASFFVVKAKKLFITEFLG